MITEGDFISVAAAVKIIGVVLIVGALGGYLTGRYVRRRRNPRELLIRSNVRTIRELPGFNPLRNCRN